MRYFVASDEDRRLDAATRRTLRGSYVELSDGVTHYELAGPEDGALVVLVGGITIPLFYWDRAAEQLHAQGLRTLTCSAYGRGGSDRVRRTYDEALFVRQLAELTAALDLTPPWHVVGTSMGALVAMAYANRYPEAAATLTVVGPAGLGQRPLPQRLLRNDFVSGFVARRFGRKLLEGHLGHNVRDPALSVHIGGGGLGVVGGWEKEEEGRKRGKGNASGGEEEVGVGVVEREDVIVGVLAVALALVVIIFAVGSDAGWSLRQYTLDLSETE